MTELFGFNYVSLLAKNPQRYMYRFEHRFLSLRGHCWPGIVICINVLEVPLCAPLLTIVWTHLQTSRKGFDL